MPYMGKNGIIVGGTRTSTCPHSDQNLPTSKCTLCRQDYDKARWLQKSKKGHLLSDAGNLNRIMDHFYSDVPIKPSREAISNMRGKALSASRTPTKCWPGLPHDFYELFNFAIDINPKSVSTQNILDNFGGTNSTYIWTKHYAPHLYVISSDISSNSSRYGVNYPGMDFYSNTDRMKVEFSVGKKYNSILSPPFSAGIDVIRPYLHANCKDFSAELLPDDHHSGSVLHRDSLWHLWESQGKAYKWTIQSPESIRGMVGKMAWFIHSPNRSKMNHLIRSRPGDLKPPDTNYHNRDGNQIFL